MPLRVARMFQRTPKSPRVAEPSAGAGLGSAAGLRVEHLQAWRDATKEVRSTYRCLVHRRPGRPPSPLSAVPRCARARGAGCARGRARCEGAGGRGSRLLRCASRPNVMRAPSAPRDEPVPTDVPAAAGPDAGWRPDRPKLRPGPAARGLDRRRGVGLCRSGSGAGLQPRSPGVCIRTRRGGRRLQRHPAGAGGGAAVAVHVPARLRAGTDRRRAGDRPCRRPAAERRAGRLVRRCAARGAGDGRDLDRAAGHAGNERQRRLRVPGRTTRGTTPGRPWRTATSRASSSSRSTGWPSRSCGARCGTGTPRSWPAGWRRTVTAWWNGRPTCRPRPGRARQGYCWGRTRTSRPSGGWRRSGGR